MLTTGGIWTGPPIKTFRGVRRFGFSTQLGLSEGALDSPLPPERRKFALQLFLRNPIGNEYVELARLLTVPCRCEDKLFAIAREHWEAIEAGAIGDAFQAGAVDIDNVKRKALTLGIVQVG